MCTRTLKSLSIAVVVAATAVPSALAMHVADGAGVTPLGGTATKTVTAYDGYKSGHPHLHAALQAGVVQPAAIRRGLRAGSPRSLPSMVVATTGTLSWGDTAIGAGGALGLLLVMSFGVMTAQHNRKGPLAA